MKIGYILYPGALVSGKSNGIRSQALSWCDILREKGHEVVLLNSWADYRLANFDIIHFFGSGPWVNDFAVQTKKSNENIIFSPVCDEVDGIWRSKVKTWVGSELLQLWSKPYRRRKALHIFKGIFVRSDFERSYIEKAYGVDTRKVYKVPLAYSFKSYGLENFSKTNFCLHVSSITHERKNVSRLVLAAKKYNFELVLAGSTGTNAEFEPLRMLIGNAKNIKVLGFVSDEELTELYKKAKVFALPSTMEGVGITALDASIYNCEIVITDIGAPKEYYGSLARIVNPYNVDSIGTAILDAFEGTEHQPMLRNHILENYSEEVVGELLETYYMQIVNSKPI